MEQYKYQLCVIFTILISLIAVHSSIEIGNADSIKEQLPSELANTNLTLDDAKNLLKEKCIQTAGEKEGEEAFAAIETAAAVLGECVSNIVNFTAVQTEIDEASPRGRLDDVFNKYCEKRPNAIKCIEEFNVKLVPCLEEEEQENNNVFMRIITSLLNFVCHKDGDQIALFIAEKGPECLESKKDNISHCINATFADYLPKEGLNDVKSLPKFIVGPKQCEDMQKLEDCVLESLEKCAEITPANIVDSMFRFIKNETICRETTSTRGEIVSTATAFSSYALLIWGIGILNSLFVIKYNT